MSSLCRSTHFLESGTRRFTVRTDAALPKGVCGVIRGIAVRCGVTDSYGTQFAVGCLDKAADRVRSGRVQLYTNHDYVTHAHVGVVTRLWREGDAYWMEAHIFDSAAGRELHEYLTAANRAGGFVGLSIGFFRVEGGSHYAVVDGQTIEVYDEINLEEISVTPRPAVPGAAVTSVRTEFRTRTPTVPPEAIAAEVRAQLILENMTEGLPANAPVPMEVRRQVVGELQQAAQLRRRAIDQAARQREAFVQRFHAPPSPTERRRSGTREVPRNEMERVRSFLTGAGRRRFDRIRFELCSTWHDAQWMKQVLWYYGRDAEQQRYGAWDPRRTDSTPLPHFLSGCL